MIDTREAAFAAEGGEWRFPTYSARHAIGEVKQATLGAWRYFIQHPREARKLHRRVSQMTSPARLSLGSGRTVPPGWLGVDFRKGKDVFRCDLRHGVPLPDGLLDGILAEHVLEHFPLDDLDFFARSCYRALKSGGAVRIVCPDARIVASLLAEERNDLVEAQLALDTRIHRWPRGERTLLRVANRLSYQFGQHRSLLTPAYVGDRLRAAGFNEVRELTPDTIGAGVRDARLGASTALARAA